MVEPAQRRHRVAHTLVVLGFLLLAPLQGTRRIGQVHGNQFVRCLGAIGRPFIQAPLQLQRKHLQQAAPLEHDTDLPQQRAAVLQAFSFDPAVRHMPRGLHRRGTLGQAAQVFDQHHRKVVGMAHSSPMVSGLWLW